MFVTVRIDDRRIAEDLKYLKVGSGSYFTFFRPYHLWFLEAPISLARAVLRRETTLVPLDHPTADVMTVAKRDLEVGESLDGFGGYTFRGVIVENPPPSHRARVRGSEEVTADPGRVLPAGLAPGAKVVRPVAAGATMSWQDVELDEDAPVVRLRRAQDERTEEGGSE